MQPGDGSATMDGSKVETLVKVSHGEVGEMFNHLKSIFPLSNCSFFSGF